MTERRLVAPPSSEPIADRNGRVSRAWQDVVSRATDVVDGRWPVRLLEVTVGELSRYPAESFKGHMLIVTDEVGGYTPAYSDGVDWRRASDRNVVTT